MVKIKGKTSTFCLISPKLYIRLHLYRESASRCGLGSPRRRTSLKTGEKNCSFLNHSFYENGDFDKTWFNKSRFEKKANLHAWWSHFLPGTGRLWDRIFSLWDDDNKKVWRSRVCLNPLLLFNHLEYLNRDSEIDMKFKVCLICHPV